MIDALAFRFAAEAQLSVRPSSGVRGVAPRDDLAEDLVEEVSLPLKEEDVVVGVGMPLKEEEEEEEDVVVGGIRLGIKMIGIGEAGGCGEEDSLFSLAALEDVPSPLAGTTTNSSMANIVDFTSFTAATELLEVLSPAIGGSNDSVSFEESFFFKVEIASSSFPMGGRLLLLLVVVLSTVDSMCFPLVDVVMLFVTRITLRGDFFSFPQKRKNQGANSSTCV